MKKNKTIRITCTAASTLPLAKMLPLQGDLKTLSEDNSGKLKASIIKHGITFPFFIWKNRGKHFIIDAHQRDKVLRQLQKEGWTVPPMPVAWIEARDEREAKEKILLCNSQYGQMTEESLGAFITAGMLDVPNLQAETVLPFDLGALIAGGADEPADAEPQINLASELNKKWKVKFGDLWQIGKHRLLCGDSTKRKDVELVMGGGYV
jgi:hypothetical protein